MPLYEFRCDPAASGSRRVAAGTESARLSELRRGGRGPGAVPQAAPFGLVKSIGAARRQEGRNAELRQQTKADFKARRQRARGLERGLVSGSAEARREELIRLYREVETCTRCPLHADRTKAVFGSGNADADLMFIGEAPGAEEDRQGLPFVGRAGQLLTQSKHQLNQ